MKIKEYYTDLHALISRSSRGAESIKLAGYGRIRIDAGGGGIYGRVEA